MPFPEYLTEADKREAWKNIIAFMEADKYAKSLVANSPLAQSSKKTHTTGKRSPARKPPIRQAHFLNNNEE